MTQKILEGMKVLDLTHAMAGPFCTQRLADMGAEVIKVEPPHGDGQRSTMIANATYEDFTTVFLSLNRNKKSISVDLKRNEGRELLYKLAAECNVIIQNFRPAVVHRLKIDYDSIRSHNPSIIYCSISGYGKDGPYAKRPGQDLIVQGYSGLMYNVGSADDEPVPAGCFLVDVTASHLATEGILAAYIHYLRTGRGQRVDVNMLEGILDHQVQEITTALNTGIVPERTREKLAHTYIGAPYGIYETADGHMTLAMNDLTRLGKVMDCDEIASMTSRFDAVNRRDDIVRILRPLLKQKPTQHWIDLFDENNIWCGPVMSLKEILADEQVRKNGYIGRVCRDGSPDLLLARNPIRFSDGELSMTMPPKLGEHSVEIMTSLGYEPDQIQKLLESGVVYHTSSGNVIDFGN